jgi:bis(5'-nucleosyl)-tetraphosphatase (symmetrical)
VSQVFLVGDVHGCFYTLDALINQLSIQAGDQLLMIGDLVGKGPHTSLVLDKLIDMGADTVLGNHDLYFIEWMLGVGKVRSEFKGITSAGKNKYLEWFLSQQFCIFSNHVLIVHAGIHYAWSLDEALYWAEQLKTLLVSNPKQLLKYMHQKPKPWEECQSQSDKMIAALYVMTKLRYFNQKGFSEATGSLDEHQDLQPWFKKKQRIACQVVFGHWAALKARPINSGFVHLDGGVVYGGDLVAYELQSGVKTRQEKDLRDEL